VNGPATFATAIVLSVTTTLLMPAAPAAAGFTSAQLRTIAAAPPQNAALPPDLAFVTAANQPTTLAQALGGVPSVVVFADYTCRTLCGPILEFAAAGLAKTGLRPGSDFRFVVIGLNPKDGPEAARTMRAAHVAAGDPVGSATVFLIGHEAEINAVTAALGFHDAYDAEHDQYAHPAAAYVIDARGRVRRVLSALSLGGAELRLALVEAGQGTVGTFADRIHLLCYGYDPIRGIYTERITTMLAIAAGATLLVMAGGLLLMLTRERRRLAP
jgi:protein SCO1